MATESKSGGLAAEVGRGVAAGLAGTVAMTAFQKLIEMPLTGRGESEAPANFVRRVLPVRAKGKRERRLLNYVAHSGIGASWGAGHGLIARATGLRGQAAIGTAFGVIYTGDVILNTALGLYRPSEWSAQDWIVDLGDKFVLAEGTGLVYDALRSD